MISDLNIRVNQELCIACGTCVDRCIMDNLRLHIPPCRIECPLHMNCQGYIRLLARGNGERAAEELRKHTPFGAILGRVCHHPCEAVCERAKNGDGAVNIRAIKRYLADNYPQITRSLPIIGKDTGRSVAVVGSGPAGMMAAYDLRTGGHAVTVYEAVAEPGGMLRWGIPSFRLPISEVKAAIDMLQQMGIRFKTGFTLGRELDLKEMTERFDAILLAVGAGPPLQLGIPGEELEGVRQGIDFIRDIKDGRVVSSGNTVIVIGGGNAAMDAALLCAKLGVPEVKIMCLERRDEMPAFRMEIGEAVEAGVQIDNCWGPRRFVRTEGGKIRVEMSRCLSMFDSAGAFCPTLDDTCRLGFEADYIIVAAGQRRTGSGYDKACLSVDPVTLQSAVEKKVFCCGDAVSGPKSVVQAMAQGKEAAVSIHRFLLGEGLNWGRNFLVENGQLPYTEPDLSRIRSLGRKEYERLPLRERTVTGEVERDFSMEAAVEEASRCLGCGRAAELNQTCWFCLPCEIECREEAIEVKIPYLIR